MEPTGIYHNNLLDFLKAREYNIEDTFLKSSNKGAETNSFLSSERIHELASSSISGECSEYKELLKLRIRKKAEGKSYKEAVIATATKLLTTLYTLPNEKRCFK